MMLQQERHPFCHIFTNPTTVGVLRGEREKETGGGWEREKESERGFLYQGAISFEELQSVKEEF
jgi:hypothetical protein